MASFSGERDPPIDLRQLSRDNLQLRSAVDVLQSRISAVKSQIDPPRDNSVQLSISVDCLFSVLTDKAGSPIDSFDDVLRLFEHFQEDHAALQAQLTDLETQNFNLSVRNDDLKRRLAERKATVNEIQGRSTEAANDHEAELITLQRRRPLPNRKKSSRSYRPPSKGRMRLVRCHRRPIPRCR
jgi:hypothetical protein